METRRVHSKHFDTGGTNQILILLPGICPRCKREVHLTTLATVHDENNVCSLYRCGGCKSFFISSGRFSNDIQRDSKSEPNNYKKQTFDETINELSPDFVEIFNEALAAESMSLLSICGVGYRKALEFLVKDYAIKINPQNEAKIIKQPLVQVISQYIQSNRIKVLAERSTWIGNDETHYERKHEDKNYIDMKKFITSMLYFISSEMVAIEAESIEKK